MRVDDMRLINLIGSKFGRLLVISRFASKGKSPKWLCRCACGTETVVFGSALRTGHTKSCGCLNREIAAAKQYRHGMSKSTEHKIWSGIIERCSNPKSQFYHRYGGRGISICERWLTFENFFADMGNRPSKFHTLDRKENDGNYEPSNCRWSTRKEQSNNTSRNVWITIDGTRKTLTQWCDQTGIDKDLASQRILRDCWSPEDAVTIPSSHSSGRNNNRNRDNGA